MNRRLLLGIILSLTVFCIGILFFYHLRGSYNHHVVSSGKWNQIMKTRKEDFSLQLSNLKFQDTSLLLDNSSDTFYYSYQDSSKKYNPGILYTSNESVKVVFSSKIDSQKVEENYDFQMMIYSKDRYHIYHLVVTSLPLLNIDSNSNLLEQYNAFSEISIYDNRTNAFHKYLSSKAEVRVLDTTTTKKDFSFSLTQESLGNNKRDNNISILGMKQHVEYTLNSMSSDPEMIRHIFSTNLWNEMYNNSHENYQYVEVFLNHQYYGLYVLGFNVEKDSMRIKPEDFLFYKQSFINSEYNYDGDGSLEGYILYDQNSYNPQRREMHRDNKRPDAWKELKNTYQIINSTDIEQLKKIAKNVSAMNIYLYYLFTQAIDHVNKDTFSDTYLLYRKGNAGYMIEYIPWNINYTFGNTYQDNHTLEYELSSSDNSYIMPYNPVTKLVELKDSEAMNAVYDNFYVLRRDEWSDQKLMEKINLYEKQLYSSGAYQRNNTKWGDGTTPKSKLAVFKTYVKDRISSMEYYINSLRG